MQRNELTATPGLYALLLLLAACGGGPDAETFRVTVLVEGGGSPPAWVVVASASGAAPLVLPCGELDAGEDPADPRGRCTMDGVSISGVLAGAHLVVKAPGFRTVDLDLPAEEPPASRSVVLQPLPDPVVTEDFATGLTPEAATATFQSHGVGADTEAGPAWALKFYIDDLQGSPVVYFQNSHRYALHYDFAYQVLGHHVTRKEFDSQTYQGADRTGMAGTLVWFPALRCASEALGGTLEEPVTVNFFPSDDLTPAQVLQAFRLLEEAITFTPPAGPLRRLLYQPAGAAQEADLEGALDAFAARDTPWIRWDELLGDLDVQILNPGVAYGTLRVMDPEELAVTPVSFRDILVLTRLPNDLPVVGGTLTEELQTPLAHVNLAARARGTPNLALPGASTDPRVAPFVGSLVRFEVAGGAFTLEETTLEEAEAWWESLRKEPVTPVGDSGPTALAAFADLGFGDSVAYGVKAANLAELSHLLPDATPAGFAVPFHYYDRFMSTVRLTPDLCEGARKDCLAEGRNPAVCAAARDLCQPPEPEGEVFYAAVARLLADPGFRTDTLLREAALDALRWAMRHAAVDPDFAAALDARVAELFGAAKVRLRSSTNTEDLPDFPGAGLYESVGAYATGEDAASGEIRKVWASVWSWKAFEERAFWSIEHSAVRMGVLVSAAFEDEAANGVLVTRNVTSAITYGMYVNVQPGDAAVANPEEGILPEILTILPAPGGGIQVSHQGWSSLSPGVPVLSDAEALSLYKAGYKVMLHFAALYGEDPYQFPFDIEFKLAGPDRRLMLKQVRPFVL